MPALTESAIRLASCPGLRGVEVDNLYPQIGQKGFKLRDCLRSLPVIEADRCLQQRKGAHKAPRITRYCQR